MTNDRKFLEALISIIGISNNKKLTLEKELNKILLVIVDCLKVKSGSILLLNGKGMMEVAASTKSRIVGVKQSLDDDSPTAWVAKNKKSLYIDSAAKCDYNLKRFKHYSGDAFFIAPVINNDRVIGVISVTDKIGSDTFGRDEREILINIAGQVIIALENNRMARSLEKKSKDLRKKNLELKKLEKLRTELFNMLIHDLKGPLSEVVANLDILSYTVKGEGIEFVETAQSGCSNLFNLVADLLDVSRLEEGKMPIVYEQLIPRDIIREANAGLIMSVKSKGANFMEDFPADDDLTFEGDRSLLIRVYQNLLTNAISYTPKGEIIKVGYKYPDPENIEFFIEDKGPGVPEEFRDEIFCKFSQIDEKFEGRVYTTGLGLNFCKKAVNAHGGMISVESLKDKGSRFYFRVPVKQVKKR